MSVCCYSNSYVGPTQSCQSCQSCVTQFGASGTLGGTGTTTITGKYTWEGGWQDQAGTTIANGGIDISTSADHLLRERTLTINGASTWTGGSILVYKGPIINNNANFDIQTDYDLLYYEAPVATINNNGTWRKTASDGDGVTDLNADFTNGGGLSVASGSVGFQQTFTQSSTGTLFVDIANGSFDSFAVSQGATLDGTLDINRAVGYLPPVATTFAIMTFSSLSGTFATIVDQSIGNGTEFAPIYNAGNVRLEVMNE